MDFGNPDFVGLAKAFGLPAFSIKAADQFPAALKEALRLDVPSIIAVPVDYSENHRLTETLGEVHISV